MTLIVTRQLAARGTYPSNLDWQNLRLQEYGYIAAAERSKLLNAQTRAFIESSSVWNAPSIQVPVMNKNKPTIVTAPMTCSFTSNEVDPELVTITFIQGHFPVEIFPVEHSGNIISMAEAFMRQVKDGEEAAADVIEAAIFTAMDTAKATASDSGFIGAGKRYGALVLDTIQVTDAQTRNFFNDGKSIMAADNFKRSDLEVIGDAQLVSYFAEFSNQGQSNSENLAFQFSGYSFSSSNSTVTSGGTTVSTGFIMPANTIDILSKVRPECAQGVVSSRGKTWGTFSSALLGFDLGFLRESDCDDAVARTDNALNTASLREQWTFEYNVAIVTPFDGSANSGIKKFDFLA